jgi:crossover junction endodeoxyribonuclease RusA
VKQRRPTISTAEQLCVTLPLPPSINVQYYTDTKGNRRLTPVALRYKAGVQRSLLNLKQQGVLNTPLLQRLSTCYLALYFECYFPTPLQRDLDGGLKIMLDAICRGLGANDNRVVEIHLSKRIRPQDPHVYVEIDTLDDWEFDEEYRVFPKAPESGAQFRESRPRSNRV